MTGAHAVIINKQVNWNWGIKVPMIQSTPWMCAYCIPSNLCYRLIVQRIRRSPHLGLAGDLSRTCPRCTVTTVHGAALRDNE